jgi:hypothetical protein
VTLDTRSLPAPEGGLQALYDRNLAIQTPGRHVTYKAIRSDFFVIAGETPTGRFYTRYASSGTTIRGFSIGYDKSLAREVDPLIVAIANSFRPFPPGAPAPVAAPPAGALPVRAAERLLGTGVALAPRRVVTTASVSACSGLRAAGAKPLQVRTVQGLTILDLVEDLKTAPLRMPAGPMGSGEPLLVLSYRLQGTRAELVATPALGGDEEGSVVAPLQAGAQGAPVVDRSGALRGLVRGGPDERRAVAGIVPPAHYRIESAAVSGLVATQDAPAGDPHPRTAADLVSSLRDAVVPITCDP